MKEEKKEAPIPMPDLAYGIYRDPQGRHYVMRIPYNGEKMLAGDMVKIGEGEDLSLARERYRIIVAKDVFK